MPLADCLCQFEWEDANGTHDTVTKEWLPDKPTKHVRLIPVEGCPVHPSDPCYECERRMVSFSFTDISPGWARRGDGLVSCPEHVDWMPPRRRA